MNYDNIEILFVEDSIDDAALTMRALKKGGLSNTIFHVKDGAEALDFMYCKGAYASRNIEGHLKLILLDLKMPKVSGMEVLGKIKSDPRFKRCYELGANSYIVKPVESDNFFQTIKDLSFYWMISNQPQA